MILNILMGGRKCFPEKETKGENSPIHSNWQIIELMQLFIISKFLSQDLHNNFTLNSLMKVGRASLKTVKKKSSQRVYR